MSSFSACCQGRPSSRLRALAAGRKVTNLTFMPQSTPGLTPQEIGMDAAGTSGLSKISDKKAVLAAFIKPGLTEVVALGGRRRARSSPQALRAVGRLCRSLPVN